MPDLSLAFRCLTRFPAPAIFIRPWSEIDFSVQGAQQSLHFGKNCLHSVLPQDSFEWVWLFKFMLAFFIFTHILIIIFLPIILSFWIYPNVTYLCFWWFDIQWNECKFELNAWTICAARFWTVCRWLTLISAYALACVTITYFTCVVCMCGMEVHCFFIAEQQQRPSHFLFFEGNFPECLRSGYKNPAGQQNNTDNFWDLNPTH